MIRGVIPIEDFIGIVRDSFEDFQQVRRDLVFLGSGLLQRLARELVIFVRKGCQNLFSSHIVSNRGRLHQYLLCYSSLQVLVQLYYRRHSSATMRRGSDLTGHCLSRLHPDSDESALLPQLDPHSVKRPVDEEERDSQDDRRQDVAER